MHVYLDKVMSIIMDQRIVLFSIKVLVSSPSCCTQESVLLPAGNEWTQEQKSIGVWLARLRMYYYTNHVKYRYLGQKHFTEWYFSNKVLLPMETLRSRPMATLQSQHQYGNWKMIKEMYIAKAFSIDDVHKMSVKSWVAARCTWRVANKNIGKLN